MRLCRYCMRLSLVLASALSCAMSRLIRLARERFRCDQTDSTGLSSEAFGGTDQNERTAELLVRGVQQPGVIRLGEALALVPAAAGMDPEDQPSLGGDPRSWPRDPARRAVPLDRGTTPSCLSIVRVLNPSYYAPYGMLASCSMYWTRRIHRNPWKVTVPSWKVSCPRRMNREIPDSGFGLPRRTRPGPRR